MSGTPAARRFPRGPLYGAAALIAMTMIIVGAARISGVSPTWRPVGPPLESRSLRFEDRPGGAIAVFDASDGREIETLAPGAGGFVRVTLRSLARHRRSAGIGAEPPFTLVRWADGRLSLDDPSTGRRIDLRAFSAPNAESFGHLLRSKAASK